MVKFHWNQITIARDSVLQWFCNDCADRYVQRVNIDSINPWKGDKFRHQDTCFTDYQDGWQKFEFSQTYNELQNKYQLNFQSPSICKHQNTETIDLKDGATPPRGFRQVSVILDGYKNATDTKLKNFNFTFFNTYSHDDDIGSLDDLNISISDSNTISTVGLDL